MLDPITAAKGLGLLKRFWPAIPILGLALTVGVQHWTIQGKNAQIERDKVTKTQLEDRNRATSASLSQALVRIDDNNRRIAEGNLRLEEQRRKSAAELAGLERKYGQTLATVKALEANAKRKPADPCRPSDMALKALETL